MRGRNSASPLRRAITSVGNNKPAWCSLGCLFFPPRVPDKPGVSSRRQHGIEFRMGSNVKWLPSMMAVDPWISEIREIRLNYGTGCHLTIPSPALYHRISWKAESLSVARPHTTRPGDEACGRPTPSVSSPTREKNARPSRGAARRFSPSVFHILFLYTDDLICSCGEL